MKSKFNWKLWLFLFVAGIVVGVLLRGGSCLIPGL